MYQSEGISRIANERSRQVEEEGWSPNHDENEHPDGELIKAAICYAAKAAGIEVRERETVFSGPVEASYCDPWPWDRKFDKRSKHSKIHCLEIAGALIAAELDRLLTVK
jgi:hypothetical protein